MSEVILPLLMNEEYDVIKYSGSESFKDISKDLKKILDLVNRKLLDEIEKNDGNAKTISLQNFDDKEEFKNFIVYVKLKKLQKKFTADELNEFFGSHQSVKQFGEIFSLLENSEIITERKNSFEFSKSNDAHNFIINVIEKLYSSRNNKKISNSEFESLYEIKKVMIDSLIDDSRFFKFSQENKAEAMKIINLIVNEEIVNEETTEREISEMTFLAENIVKFYPENSANALKYFILNGKEMMPIYKEIYKYLEYYSQTGAVLDYNIALKITKECKKKGIVDAELFKSKLNFTELQSLIRIMNRKQFKDG